jgi:outer membrane protein assembly factor BamD
LALNSYERSKQQRLEEAKAAYAVLKKQYPETEYAKKADNLLGKIEKELQNYSVESK